MKIGVAYMTEIVFLLMCECGDMGALWGLTQTPSASVQRVFLLVCVCGDMGELRGLTQTPSASVQPVALLALAAERAHAVDAAPPVADRRPLTLVHICREDKKWICKMRKGQSKAPWNDWKPVQTFKRVAQILSLIAYYADLEQQQQNN